MAYDSDYSKNSKEYISPRVAENGCGCFLQTDWQEEDDHADNLLGRVALLACYLCVHRQGVVVVNSHLKE